MHIFKLAFGWWASVMSWRWWWGWGVMSSDGDGWSSPTTHTPRSAPPQLANSARHQWRYSNALRHKPQLEAGKLSVTQALSICHILLETLLPLLGPLVPGPVPLQS